MQQLSIALSDEQAIIDRVFTVTSGHPNLVQYLCDRLVNQADERCVTLAMVDDVVSSQAFVDHFVETAWSQSTPLEKLITLLPAETTFTRDWLLRRLAERGIDDRAAIDSAIETWHCTPSCRRTAIRCASCCSTSPPPCAAATSTPRSRPRRSSSRKKEYVRPPRPGESRQPGAH